eukprot:gene3228-biopygen11916
MKPLIAFDFVALVCDPPTQRLGLRVFDPYIELSSRALYSTSDGTPGHYLPKSNPNDCALMDLATALLSKIERCVASSPSAAGMYRALLRRPAVLPKG